MTSLLSSHLIATHLNTVHPELRVNPSETFLVIEPAEIDMVCNSLKRDYQMDLLSSITAVDFVEYFELVYHLTSIATNTRCVIKTRCYDRKSPSVPSVTSVWKGAELQEREIYDLMGVKFKNHPNLKRILLWEGFQGHPLRKDFLEPPLPYTWPHGG